MTHLITGTNVNHAAVIYDIQDIIPQQEIGKSHAENTSTSKSW
jgi:hypothetical protein